MQLNDVTVRMYRSNMYAIVDYLKIGLRTPIAEITVNFKINTFIQQPASNKLKSRKKKS